MQKSKLLKSKTSLIVILFLLITIVVYSCTNGSNTKDVKVDSTTPSMSDSTVKKMDSTLKKNGTLTDSVPDTTHKTEQNPPPPKH